MRFFLKAIDSMSEWSGKLFAFIIYGGMVVLVYEVLARYIFVAPTIWAHGLSQRIFCAYYLMSGAYVLLHKGHINMDLIYNRFSIRQRAILDLITAWLVIGTGVVIAWQGSIFAWTSLKNLEVCLSAWRAPLYPVKVLVPVSGVLLTLQALAKFIRDLHTAITGREYEH